MGSIGDLTAYLDSLYNSQQAVQKGMQQSIYSNQLAMQQARMNAYNTGFGGTSSSITPLAYGTVQKKARTLSTLDWLNAEIDRVRLPLT